MALPAAFPRERVTPMGGAILVSLVPGDPTFEVELQRAPDSGGSPGTWATIANLPPIPRTGLVFQDKLPLDGVLRYYRARHVRQGWNPGNWTAASAGVAPVSPRTVPMRAGGDVGVEIAFNPVNLQGVGTAALSTPLERTIRIAAQELVPANEGQLWAFNETYVSPGDVGVQLSLYGPVVMPPGVTLTAFRARYFRAAAGDTASAQLSRISGDSPTLIASVTHTGTGWATDTDTLTQLVGAEAYTVAVVLLSGTLAADARLQWIELDYTRPTIAAAY